MEQTPEIQLQIRFFAGAAEAAGCEEITIKVPEDYRLDQAIQAGISQDLQEILAVASFLVDGSLTSADTKVAQLAAPQVDVLPPFAGG